MTGSRGRVTVGRADLLKNVVYLRTLFRTLGLDVKPYSDDALVETLLSVAAIMDDQWPSDAQLHEAFARLRAL
jgi:hypothetical protein